MDVVMADGSHCRAKAGADGSFALVLAEGFLDLRTLNSVERLSTDIGYVVGDGTRVCLGDRIILPDSVGRIRGGTSAIVVGLQDDGLALRFREAVDGIRTEHFLWEEIAGARMSGDRRSRRRRSVTPPGPVPEAGS
jgi:hypothetical protein